MNALEARQLVTTTQIATLAGVALSTVSNWRVRSSSFPSPAGGNESRPLFDLREIREWMAETGKEVKTPERQATAVNLLALLRGIASPAEYLGLMLPILCLALSEKSATKTVRSRAMTGELLRRELQEANARLMAVNSQVGRAVEESLASLSGKDATLLEIWNNIWDQDLEALEEELFKSARKAARQTSYLGDSRDLAELLVGLAGDEIGTFADLACGFGEVLSVAAALPTVTRLAGRDIDSAALAVTACRMFLRDRSADLRIEDALGNLGTGAFDKVVLSPPLSARHPDGRHYPPASFPFGLPKDGALDLGWPQIAIDRLRSDGTAVVVVPSNALFEAGATREIRQRLLSFGTIEAVIGLPQGAHYGTGMPSAVFVLRKPGQARRKDEVFMSEVAVDRRGGLQGIDRVITDFNLWLTGYLQPNAHSVGVPVVSLLAPEASLNPAYWLAMEQPANVAGILNEYETAVTETRIALDAMSGQRSEPAKLTHAAPYTPTNLMALGVKIHRGTSVRDKVPGDAGHGDEPVLTAEGVNGLAESTHYVDEADAPAKALRTESGDVALIVHKGRLFSGVCESAGMLVDAGVTILRVDPSVVDPYFLAAAVLSAANQSVLVGNVSIRIDAERLRVPDVPMEQQRNMGAAYRETLHLRYRIDAASAAQTDLEMAVSGAIASGCIEFSVAP